MLKHNDLTTNSIFILSFWAVSLIFYIVLNLLPEIHITQTNTPPDYLQFISPIMLSIMGGYLALFLIFGIYDLLNGKKLNKSTENLTKYGVISFATLGMVFIDLLDIMSTGFGYFGHAYSGTTLPLWQEIFLHILFPTVCLAIVILVSRYVKIEYEEKTPIGL